jgi:hypothetical protein
VLKNPKLDTRFALGFVLTRSQMHVMFQKPLEGEAVRVGAGEAAIAILGPRHCQPALA